MVDEVFSRDDAGEVDVIVLGAGVSGLVAASLLVRQGHRRVLVVDEYDHVGGNHIDWTVGGCTFDVGCFIFQDDSPLLGHFPELLERYVPIDPSWGKLTPQGTVGPYPFSLRDDVLARGVIELLRIGASVVSGRLRHRTWRSAGDYARYWVGGRFLQVSGLGRYIERLCGTPADRVDVRFARSRMGWIGEHARLRSLPRRLLVRHPAPPANRQLARSRSGFAHQYQPAVERLERDGVTFLLNAKPTRLAKDGAQFVLHERERVVRADRVVSTIPIDRVQELCGLPAAEPLPTVTLISLFFSFAGERGFTDPILYNFSDDGWWKRLTVYSDFYGPAQGREYFGVEVTGQPAGTDADAAEADFRAHVEGAGLLAGDLRLEGSHVLTNAYPVYTAGSQDRAADAIVALRALGIESLGRQGGFEYQPTARASTVAAEAALRSR